MAAPAHCRPRAYRLFEEALRDPDAWEGLLAAATAVSLHELPDGDPEAVAWTIRGYAEAVRARVQSERAEAVLAHLHAVLFDEEGFRGNTEDYYDPHNSYLPSILETRRGIPITLTLLYKCVGEQLGLEIEGVNAPGHFLARVRTGDAPMLVDPFFAGRVLSRDEAFELIERVTGASVERHDAILPAASHRQWLERMLNNLCGIFSRTGREKDLAAMLELRALL
jgi:regulator of sirC expression with transglutaminase-like and TPR domain